MGVLPLRFRFSIREQQIVFVFSLKFIFIHKFKMVREDKASWKAGYFTKIVQLLDDYPKCFLVEADNVGSKQMQQIRISLRGHAVVLMGKNTMMPRPSAVICPTIPSWSCFCLILRATLASSSPRRSWSTSGTCSWRTRSKLPPRQVPLLLWMSPFRPKTPVLVLRRLLSSKP